MRSQRSRHLDVRYASLSLRPMSTKPARANGMRVHGMRSRVFRLRSDLWEQRHHLLVSDSKCVPFLTLDRSSPLCLPSIRSKCHLEHDACTRHVNIEPIHMGQCDNCHNVTCPFFGQCRSEQGNYTCVCPAIDTCPPVRVSSCFLTRC